MLVYPSSMPVSNRALQVLADVLRHTARHWAADGGAWPPGRQALLVLAHLRKGETYTALAGGFGVGTTHGVPLRPRRPRRARRGRTHAGPRRSMSPAARRS